MNLVSVLLISSAPFLLAFTSPIVLAVFIISLAITHTFLDAIPSIYLGAPTEAQALNVLPGHRLLMKGLGHNAIMYTVIGARQPAVEPAFISAVHFQHGKIISLGQRRRRIFIDWHHGLHDFER